MQTVRNNAHDIAQSQGSGWSARAATELARKRKLIALIGLLLACLLFSAVVAPESAAARIPAPTENMSPWCGLSAAICLCLLGIGSMILAYAHDDLGSIINDTDGFFRSSGMPCHVRVAFGLICIALLILEVVSYAMLFFEAFPSHVLGAFMGPLLLLVVCTWPICRLYLDLGTDNVGLCVRSFLGGFLLSVGLVAAVVPPVVALFWMVGRHGIALMFTWVARGRLRVVDLLNFTGCIWALYSLALLYLFRYGLHGLVFWICTLDQASPTDQGAKEAAVMKAWNRWMSLYLLGWTIVVCAQLVATMLNVQQLFRSAPALMMTVMAPQIPLIAAHELMPFRFAKGVSQMQLVVLVSSVAGLIAAVVHGYQGGGVVSPVIGGTGLGTLVSVSTFGLGVLLSILVDRVRQCFRNSELRRQQACLQTEPSLPLTP